MYERGLAGKGRNIPPEKSERVSEMEGNARTPRGGPRPRAVMAPEHAPDLPQMRASLAIARVFGWVGEGASWWPSGTRQAGVEGAAACPAAGDERQSAALPLSAMGAVSAELFDDDGADLLACQFAGLRLPLGAGADGRGGRNGLGDANGLAGRLSLHRSFMPVRPMSAADARASIE